MTYAEIKPIVDPLLKKEELVYIECFGSPRVYLARILYIDSNEFCLMWVDQVKMCIYSETACPLSLDWCVAIRPAKILMKDIEISTEEIYPWDHPTIAPPNNSFSSR